MEEQVVVIRNSAISGQGSFAKEDIPKGSYITTLIGTPFKKVCVVESNDPLQIDEQTYLHLDHASKTINHSCDPNAGIRNQSDLYAIKDIKMGDELTYDYSTTIGTDDNIACMPCLCGANNCRGKIGNVLTISKQTLSYYTTINALPDFIKRELALAFEHAH
jgi:SET domain-containing protein